MNIAILSRGYSLYSTQSLLKAGEARNHNMEVLDPQHCTLAVEQGEPKLYFRDEVVDDLHAVIPRIGASHTFYGANVVRHFQSMDVFSTVKAHGILQSRDKWHSFQVLAAANVAVPNTALVDYSDYELQLKRFPSGPIIIKVLEGTHGHGVILAESREKALPIIETLLTGRQRFVIQEYIEESNGCDIRAIVVDGVVVAAMKRQSKDGDFRSNLHRGGSSSEIKLSHDEERSAIRAAKALKLGVCGVDILQSERGPLVLEVNSTPGLEGIETTTGRSVSKSIIGYIERNKPRGS
ncbi:ATP-grasp domain-containing protein [Luteirhabdus pelagi]|uniref:ATP-grasp domain-containing protein n=1 Tax=Luteirhabdus pelagi TaxID=2792783 RepID=UPI00193A1D89|nr:RimK family alpha-L-glutamate ligase [Luteirhabdus pelagi]